ncbi:MAG TPA: hypothetical protein DCQ98_10995 [Planctomycetaceae bacterium]|nr:hypothetical protein [Planctomycetaceae bacterium]HRE99014.1 hypothetical protein [Pirellulaceae bacterium]
MIDARRPHLRILAVAALVALQTAFGTAVTADEPKGISFDDVKFPIERDAEYDASLLTPEILALDGQQIKIRGYIRPSVKQSGIQKFILVRDNLECCFGPGAMLFDCMIVRLGEGETTEFTTRPIAVSGTFYIKPFKGPDDRIWAVFNLRDAKVD